MEEVEATEEEMGVAQLAGTHTRDIRRTIRSNESIVFAWGA